MDRRRKSAWSLFAVAAMVTVLSFAGSLWWGLELLSHFRLQFAWSLTLVTLAIAWLRDGKLVAAFAACAAIHGSVVAADLVATQPMGSGNSDAGDSDAGDSDAGDSDAGDTSAPDADAGKRVRLTFINLLAQNDDHAAVLGYLRSENPDIIVLVEVSHTWLAALSELDGYPTRFAQAQFDNFGVALLSRSAMRGGVQYLGGVGAPPSVVGTDLSRSLTIIGTHPWPPVTSEFAAKRNRQLTALAARTAADNANGNAVVLAGDLNVTPWSPTFHTLIRDGNLTDSRLGFGLQTTWPAPLPFFLRIPIDHVLISPRIRTVARRVGPVVGSDHLPVTVDLALQ